MKRRGFLVTFLTVAGAGSVYAQATDPLPFTIGFEASEGYSTTFNGTGVINAGGTIGAQAGWDGGGALFVVSSGAIFSGAQCIEQRCNQATGTVSGFRFVPIQTSGVSVLSIQFQYTNSAGRTAFGLELWGNQFSTGTGNRLASILVNDDTGALYLRARSAVTSSTSQPFLAANPPLAQNTWVELMVAYDTTSKTMRGWVNGNPLVDLGGVPLEYTVTDLATTDFRFPSIAYFNSNTTNRQAAGIVETATASSDTARWDNLRLDMYPARSVRIKCNLDGYVGPGRPLTNIPATITFTPTGGGTPTVVTANLNSRGEAIAAAPTAGSYKVTVKPSGWVSRSINNLTIPEVGAYGLSLTMPNGDVDGSGEVDAGDIDVVIANFGGSGDNLVSDADGTGEVDAADIDVVIASFGASDE